MPLTRFVVELLEQGAQLKRRAVLAVRHHRDCAEVLAVDLSAENFWNWLARR
jgi:hypothetical protein